MGQEDPLEEEMVTYSSILAWEIPWTEEPGRLQSMGVGKSQTSLSGHTTHPHTHIRFKHKTYSQVGFLSANTGQDPDYLFALRASVDLHG